MCPTGKEDGRMRGLSEAVVPWACWPVCAATKKDRLQLKGDSGPVIKCPLCAPHLSMHVYNVWYRNRHRADGIFSPDSHNSLVPPAVVWIHIADLVLQRAHCRLTPQQLRCVSKIVYNG